MKLILNLIALIIFSASLPAQDCKTGIQINSDTGNLQIVINDSLEYFDEKSIELPEGFYNVSILENSDRWDAKTYSDSFYLDSCTVKNIKINFRDEILINSNPQDAMVIAGDSLVGFTPLRFSGSYGNITVKKHGYAENQINFNSETSEINVNLDFIGQ